MIRQAFVFPSILFPVLLLAQPAAIEPNDILRGLEHDAKIIVARAEGKKLTEDEKKVIVFLEKAFLASSWTEAQVDKFANDAIALKQSKPSSSGDAFEGCVSKCIKSGVCRGGPQTACCHHKCMTDIVKSLAKTVIVRLKIQGEMQILNE